MVDVVEVQECLMSELAESLEVIVLVFYPVRVHLPQHPLACHLEKAAASPCVANGVGGYLQLEAVAKLMRKAVELAVLYTVGRHPQCTDEIVVSASVGRTLKAVVQHDHHLVTSRVRTEPLFRYAEKADLFLKQIIRSVKKESFGFAF